MIRVAGGVDYVFVGAGDVTTFVQEFSTSRIMRAWYRYVSDSDAGIAAVIDGRCIGVLAYQLDGPALFPRGTYVLTRHRKHGIAYRLWNVVLNAYPQISTVDVEVVSEEGKALISKLTATRPDVRFRVIRDNQVA